MAATWKLIRCHLLAITIQLIIPLTIWNCITYFKKIYVSMKTDWYFQKKQNHYWIPGQQLPTFALLNFPPHPCLTPLPSASPSFFVRPIVFVIIKFDVQFCHICCTFCNVPRLRLDELCKCSCSLSDRMYNTKVNWYISMFSANFYERKSLLLLPIYFPGLCNLAKWSALKERVSPYLLISFALRQKRKWLHCFPQQCPCSF